MLFTDAKMVLQVHVETASGSGLATLPALPKGERTQFFSRGGHRLFIFEELNNVAILVAVTKRG